MKYITTMILTIVLLINLSCSHRNDGAHLSEILKSRVEALTFTDGHIGHLKCRIVGDIDSGRIIQTSVEYMYDGQRNAQDVTFIYTQDAALNGGKVIKDNGKYEGVLYHLKSRSGNDWLASVYKLTVRL